MTDEQVERRLEQALSRTAPDDLDGVLSRCETRKGIVIPMEKKTTKRTLRTLIAACLALAIVGGGGGLFYQQTYAVASVVSLDVNPSIELKVSKSERVISCAALNEDAALILADMGGGADLKGTKLDVAVNALVGALVRNGYLDSISSAILISVEDKNENRAAKLQQELTSAVDAALQEQSSGAAVLSQTVTQDPELETQARENNISTGKAYLVRQVMEMNGWLALNSRTVLDQLSALSVEELKDMLDTGASSIPIGKGAAIEAAERYAGTLEISSVTSRADPELDDHPACYEVELHHPTLGEFEYRIDAYTGKVLSGQKDILNSVQTPDKPQTDDKNDIGQDKALSAALKHAGLQKSKIADLTIKQDRDDGRLEYEMEFWVGNTEYEYTVDAATGKVLDYEVTPHPSTTTGSSSGSTSSSDIGEKGAKEAALKAAKLDNSQVTRMKVERDSDDGRLEYDVEFWVGNMEYDYTIDGLTGAVLAHESELHESKAVSPDKAEISLDDAKQAALNHAGYDKSQVKNLKASLDQDDKRLEYEVSFYTDDAEYEYTIDATTGKVLSHERDDNDRGHDQDDDYDDDDRDDDDDD